MGRSNPHTHSPAGSLLCACHNLGVKNPKSRPIAEIGDGGHRETLRLRRDALVVEHLHLVRAIAVNVRKSLPPSFDLEDLVGVGHIAVLQGATRYRPEAHGGTPFSAYARVRIRGAILDSVRRRHYTENTRPPIEDVPPVGEWSGLDEKIDGERNVVRMRQAVELLPVAQRIAVERRYFGGGIKGGEDLERGLEELRRRLKVA